MKKLHWLLGSFFITAFVILIFVEPLTPFFSSVKEVVVMRWMPNEWWRRSIAADPSDHGYSGYEILSKRGSDAAIAEALRDLDSTDAYVWINAAAYLGGWGRQEAVPYLIKGLRHTAWRSDAERVKMLQQLTKQTIGNDFDRWRSWYEAEPDAKKIDWNSYLGHAPRLSGGSRVPAGTLPP